MTKSLEKKPEKNIEINIKLIRNIAKKPCKEQKIDITMIRNTGKKQKKMPVDIIKINAVLDVINFIYIRH